MGERIIDERFLQQLELFSLAVKDNVSGLFGGSHQSKRYGSSCEFADYRKYEEGDDITKIDWNIYGRFEELYLKLYLDEKQMNTRIYIDTSRSMDLYGKRAYALRLACAFSYLSVAEMDRVSVYAVKGHRAEPIFEKIIGRERFLETADRFDSIEFGGESYISDAISNSEVGFGDGKSIIISDFLTDNDYLQAVDYLRSKRRDVLLVQLLAPEEVDPTVRGRSMLFDSEDSERFYKGNITRDILKAYHLAMEYIQNKISDYCLAREADFVVYPTSMPLRELFMDELVNRGIVR